MQAVTEAGQYIQSQINQSNEIQGKTGGDTLASQVVTEVDFKAQEIILKYLKPSISEYDHGLLTEELVDDRSRLIKDYFWCIDPLDGTLPFTEKRPGYAVSIALVAKAGNPVLGVVYLPNEEVSYTAIKGEGVRRNGKLFERASIQDDKQLHWYMDRSFQSAGNYERVKENMVSLAHERNLDLTIHSTAGAVANAVGVMHAHVGCYFKFPKKNEGGGSIWDYAATRLIFEELGLEVSNTQGERLYLNDPKTTFMNQQGVVYATDEELKRFLLGFPR